MTTVTSQVAISDGDVSWHNEGVGSYSRTAATILLGDSDSANFNRWAAVLLPNITVPQGAPVTEAHLTLKATGLTGAIPVPLTIQAHDVDNAAATTSRTTIESWATTQATTASVAWDGSSTPALTAWVSTTNYDSPDLKTVIQEIVNRPGWVSGNSILLFIKTVRGAFTTAKAMSFRAFDNTPLDAAKLTVNYSTVFSGTANAGPDQTGIVPYATVTLTSAGSTGSPTAWRWTALTPGAPALSATNVASPTFTAPGTLNGTTLTWGLEVGDGSTWSAQDTVNTVINSHDAFVRKAGVWVPAQWKARKSAAWV